MTPEPYAGFRRAGLGDLDAIAALELSCFGADDGRFGRRQLRTLLGSRNAFWLIHPDGCATACWLRVSNGRARWARLYSLAVHPDRRGQGLAQRLLSAGSAWMRTERLPACRAEVSRKNHTAYRLYVRAGFREVGVLPDYYGPGIDGVRLLFRQND